MGCRRAQPRPGYCPARQATANLHSDLQSRFRIRVQRAFFGLVGADLTFVFRSIRRSGRPLSPREKRAAAVVWSRAMRRTTTDSGSKATRATETDRGAQSSSCACDFQQRIGGRARRAGAGAARGQPRRRLLLSRAGRRRAPSWTCSLYTTRSSVLSPHEMHQLIQSRKNSTFRSSNFPSIYGSREKTRN